MASYSKGGKITFGFRNVNGQAFSMKIEEAPDGTFIDRLTLPTLRNHIVSVMNKHGRAAESLAKSPGWSPYLFGNLVNSIAWQSARRSGFGNLIIGNLTVGVPYGRRQEFEHKTKKLYLLRAIRAVYPAFVSEIQNAGAIDDIILGKRKDTRGAFR